MIGAAMNGKLGKLSDWLPDTEDTTDGFAPPQEAASSEL